MGAGKVPASKAAVLVALKGERKVYITISAAYGRSYKNQTSIKKDWNDGKDFIIRSMDNGGRYINKQDAKTAGFTSVNVRYSNDRKVMVINF